MKNVTPFPAADTAETETALIRLTSELADVALCTRSDPTRQKIADLVETIRATNSAR